MVAGKSLTRSYCPDKGEWRFPVFDSGFMKFEWLNTARQETMKKTRVACGCMDFQHVWWCHKIWEATDQGKSISWAACPGCCEPLWHSCKKSAQLLLVHWMFKHPLWFFAFRLLVFPFKWLWVKNTAYLKNPFVKGNMFTKLVVPVGLLFLTHSQIMLILARRVCSAPRLLVGGSAKFLKGLGFFLLRRGQGSRTQWGQPIIASQTSQTPF